MTGARALTWVGVFAGPVAWSLDHVASYALTDRVHASGDKRALLVVTAIALSVILVGTLAAARVVRSARSESSAWRFLAASALALNLFFLLAIGANAIGKVVHGPRD